MIMILKKHKTIPQTLTKISTDISKKFLSNANYDKIMDKTYLQWTQIKYSSSE